MTIDSVAQLGRRRMFRFAYRLFKHARGIGRLPFGGAFMGWSSDVLGLNDYGYSERWRRLGIAFMPLPDRPYHMGLNMGVWAQRLSHYEGKYYEVSESLFVKRALKGGDVFIDVGVNVGFQTNCQSNVRL